MLFLLTAFSLVFYRKKITIRIRHLFYPVIHNFRLYLGSSSVSPISGNVQDTSIVDFPNGTVDTESYFSSGVLGVFTGVIDEQSLTGELTPLRSSASKDVLEVVDITNFLSLAPCSDCVKLHSVEINADGNIVANIGVRHPFGPADPLKPPTGQNRMDLHVFNIEGIVAMSSTINDYFSGFGTTVANGGLLNASGYTNYLANALNAVYPNDANIHPYILHYRDYTNGNYDPANTNGFADPLVPSGYLVMPMGGAEDIQPYVLDFTSVYSSEFVLAIGCTYGISAENKVARLNPVYDLPQFNKKAASEVFVEVTENTLSPGAASSSATLMVSVLDMNYGVAVGENVGEMRAASDVAAISVEVSGVTSSPVVLSSPTPTGGDPRDPINPLTYEISFTNSALATMGTYRGLVKVTDSYTPGLNESPLLVGSDGIERVSPITSPLEGIFEISEFATYQAFSIEVAGNQGPVVDLQASDNPVESGCNVDFFPGPGTYDPEGDNMVLYEYDFDYNGITFDIDASNTTGDPVTIQLLNPGSTNFDIDVALRITDDGDPVASGIGILTVTITPYEMGISFVNNPTELPTWVPLYHGTQLDPAICLESDNELCVTAAYRFYSSPTNDFHTNQCVHSNDGVNWTWTRPGVGSGYIGPPFKIAADLNDGDSYSFYGWSTQFGGNPINGNFFTRTSDPYEYAWFSMPFEHSNEAYGSAASGHLFVFGDSQNRLEVRRSQSPHVINDNWTLILPSISDSDPYLSWVRSVDEDSTGSMSLAYYTVDQDIIKFIRSDDGMANNWTEGTAWDNSTGYSGVKDPGLWIDTNDGIHISFVRHNDTSGQDEACYTASYDGGATFIDPVVAYSTTNTIPNAAIVQKFVGCHSVVCLLYEEDGDIRMALSWSGGAQFVNDIVVSDMAEPELNPDFCLDSNDDIVFCWEVTDGVYGGSSYSRKAQTVQL